MNERPDPEYNSPGRPPKTGDLRRDTKPLKRKRPKWIRRLASPRRMAAIALVSLALLLAAGAGWWYFTGGFTPAEDSENVLFTPPGSLESLATEYPELATILQDPNMDSAYKDFLLAYQTGGEDAALALAEERGLLNANGDLRLTLELDTTDTAGLEAELEANWIEVTAVSGNRMDIAIPLERLQMMMAAGTIGDFLSGITTLEHVVRIRLPKVSIEDRLQLQTTAAPTLTVSPLTGTPRPAATTSPVGFVQSPDNILVVILGVLACVVAPVLFALGAYLLLSGLGYIRRRGEPGGSSAVRPSGLTPPRRPETAPGQQGGPVRPPANPVPSPWAEPGPPVGAPPALQRRDAAPPPIAPPTSPHQAVREPEAPSPQPLPAQSPPAGRQPEWESCPNCGRANRRGAKFCLACGTRLEAPPEPAPPPDADLTAQSASPPAAAAPQEAPEHPRFCWNCGQALRTTSRFCPHCGDPV